MILNAKELSVKENYKLLVGGILPRPIALISTVSESGISNLAPFSFFMGITSKPATICFSSASKKGPHTKKDTLSNINFSGEFVINVVSENIVRQMHESAKEFPADVSEFDETGLTPVPSQIVKPPRVKESPINLECQLFQSINIGDGSPGSGTLVIGEIVVYHIDDSIYEDGSINTSLLNPIGKLAGLEYTTLGRRFKVE